MLEREFLPSLAGRKILLSTASNLDHSYPKPVTNRVFIYLKRLKRKFGDIISRNNIFEKKKYKHIQFSIKYLWNISSNHETDNFRLTLSNFKAYIFSTLFARCTYAYQRLENKPRAIKLKTYIVFKKESVCKSCKKKNLTL